jgi:hypothetical protein
MYEIRNAVQKMYFMLIGAYPLPGGITSCPELLVALSPGTDVRPMVSGFVGDDSGRGSAFVELDMISPDS